MLVPFACLIPIFQCLKDFRNVKKCCLSSKLQPKEFVSFSTRGCSKIR